MSSISYDDILQKDILELLDLQDISEEKKQEIYTKIYETVETRAILRMDALFTDEQVETWKKLLEQGDREATRAFLAEHKIDVQKIMLEEMAIFKAQLVFMIKGEPADQPLAAAAGV